MLFSHRNPDCYVACIIHMELIQIIEMPAVTHITYMYMLKGIGKISVFARPQGLGEHVKNCLLGHSAKGGGGLTSGS